MKKLFFHLSSFLLILSCLLVFGCSQGDTKQDPGTGKTAKTVESGVITLGPKEAAALLAKRQDVVLLDLRKPEELKNGAIERSTLTPFWSLVRGTINLPKDKPIMLVCAVGGRSYAAAQILVRNGYREVYNIRGGIIAWRAAGLPLKYWTQPSAAAASQ